MGFELMTSSLPRMRSTPELHRLCTFSGSGKRGSNSRPSAWKADALPTELLPRLLVGGGGLEPPNPEGADLQSAAIATMRTSHVQFFPFWKRSGADRGIRTHDPEITNHVLWPTELYRLVFASFPKGIAKIGINSNSAKLFEIILPPAPPIPVKSRRCRDRRRSAGLPGGPGG